LAASQRVALSLFIYQLYSALDVNEVHPMDDLEIASKTQYTTVYQKGCTTVT
jgi:hypothetical protein